MSLAMSLGCETRSLVGSQRYCAVGLFPIHRETVVFSPGLPYEVS